jgi:hypothetical protein
LQLTWNVLNCGSGNRSRVITKSINRIWMRRIVYYNIVILTQDTYYHLRDVLKMVNADANCLIASSSMRTLHAILATMHATDLQMYATLMQSATFEIVNVSRVRRTCRTSSSTDEILGNVLTYSCMQGRRSYACTWDMTSVVSNPDWLQTLYIEQRNELDGHRAQLPNRDNRRPTVAHWSLNSFAPATV